MFEFEFESVLSLSLSLFVCLVVFGGLIIFKSGRAILIVVHSVCGSGMPFTEFIVYVYNLIGLQNRL